MRDGGNTNFIHECARNAYFVPGLGGNANIISECEGNTNIVSECWVNIHIIRMEAQYQYHFRISISSPFYYRLNATIEIKKKDRVIS